MTDGTIQGEFLVPSLYKVVNRVTVLFITEVQNEAYYSFDHSFSVLHDYSE